MSSMNPRSKSALIRTEVYSYRRPKEENPGPGNYDKHLTKFGADVTANIGMGSKYEFKPDKNPAVGSYNIDSGHNMSKASIRSAHIREETSPYRRPKDNNPGAGHYDGHLDKFGSKITHKMDFGSKYEFKPDSNPPVGGYNPDSGHAMISTSKRSRSALIREDVYSFRRPVEENPGPGNYDKHLDAFGSKVTQNIGMGSKYVFKADRNPPVGAYNIESGHNMSKASIRSAIIREETSPYRRPQENSPGPGHHDGHLDAFGSKITQNIGMGSKYEFKPDSNPPVGAYNIESGHNMSKASSKSAIIREETSPYRRPKE